MHIRTSHNGSLTVTPSEERQQVIAYLTQHDAVVEFNYEFDSERFITLTDIVIADGLLDSVLSGYTCEHEVTIDMTVDYADELNTGHRRATITVEDGTTSVEVIEADDECASVGAYYRFGYEGMAEDFVDFTAEGIQQAIDAELVDVEEGFNSEAFADFVGDTQSIRVSSGSTARTNSTRVLSSTRTARSSTTTSSRSRTRRKRNELHRSGLGIL